MLNEAILSQSILRGVWLEISKERYNGPSLPGLKDETTVFQCDFITALRSSY